MYLGLPADTLNGHRERFYSHFAEYVKLLRCFLSFFFFKLWNVLYPDYHSMIFSYISIISTSYTNNSLTCIIIMCSD